MLAQPCSGVVIVHEKNRLMIIVVIIDSPSILYVIWTININYYYYSIILMCKHNIAVDFPKNMTLYCL